MAVPCFWPFGKLHKPPQLESKTSPNAAQEQEGRHRKAFAKKKTVQILHKPLSEGCFSFYANASEVTFLKYATSVKTLPETKTNASVIALFCIG